MSSFRPLRVLRDSLRVVLPHPAWSITPVVLYGVIELIFLLQWPQRAANECPGAMVFTLYALAYGVYRAFYFHPLYRPDYRRWLLSVPWSVEHRLPLGPVHLVWQDVVLVGVMTGMMAWRLPTASPMVVPVCFFLTFTLGTIITLGMLENWTASLLIFALGAVVRFAEHPWIVSTWLVSITLLSFIGHRQSLREPSRWDETWWGKQGFSEAAGRPDQTLQERARNQILGWPWDFASLKRNDTPITLLTGFTISVLLAWWVHAGLYYLEQQVIGNVLELYWLMVLPTGIVAIARTGIYCWGHLPPLSLLGRLATFRWIIPGYDKVLLAPLCILLLGWYGPLVLHSWNLHPMYGIPMLTYMIFQVALTMPPSLDQWRFTGNHRIVNMASAQPETFVRTR